MFQKVFSTKVNVAANFIGNIWTAIFSVIFLPMYLPYIGIEAYGLIGVFLSLQSFLALLDFGLSPTLNRELARLAALGNQAQEMRDLKRTLEIINWCVASLIGIALLVISPFIAEYWVQPKTLTIATITQAMLIMSITTAIQFSSAFYVGGLLGLQKQLYLNIINMTASTLRSAGAFLIVAFISPTIQAFLVWQSFVVVFQLIAVSLLLKFSLPDAPKKGVFRKTLLQKVWRFAAGMTGITIAGLILSQTDKVILSRMLSLEDFGYYTLALTISGMAVLTIIGSITNSVYPRFSGLVSIGDNAKLQEFYHQSCQILAAFLMPVVTIIAVFSYQILLIWTQNETIAANTHLLLTIVIIGMGLNGLVWLPYHLQLAYGWTKLGFYINIGAIIFLIPIMIGGVLKYGAFGGAASFALLNIIYIILNIQLMHRRLLKKAKWKWYLQDNLMPLAVTATAVAVGRFLFSENWSVAGKVFYFAMLGAFTFGAIVMLLPQLRRLALGYIMDVTSPKHSYN